MIVEYMFRVEIEVSDEIADATGNGPTPEWKAAVQASCREFADNLNAFLEKQPLVRAARLERERRL